MGTRLCRYYASGVYQATSALSKTICPIMPFYGPQTPPEACFARLIDVSSAIRLYAATGYSMAAPRLLRNRLFSYSAGTRRPHPSCAWLSITFSKARFYALKTPCKKRRILYGAPRRAVPTRFQAPIQPCEPPRRCHSSVSLARFVTWSSRVTHLRACG